ncbi:MAG: ATP-binding protein [Sphaerochaeta sp.]|jgi:hypothetical protein|nr:ATP-binding protein [Sphaerochaeta sp.]
MAIQFRKAERSKTKLRLALTAVSYGGKTLSSLLIAKGMGGRTAVIDTENGSASLYADHELLDGWKYEVLELCVPYSPSRYVEVIKAAEQAGYDNIIIDSLSHAWSGDGGILAKVDQHNKKVANSGWREMTPEQNRLLEAITGSKCHVIVTMRDKTEYSYERNADGKIEPRKIGLSPIQRPDIEYEFTVVLDLNRDHMATVSKDRTNIFGKDDVFLLTEQTGRDLKTWFDTGKAAVPKCARCERDGMIVDATEKRGEWDLCAEHASAYDQKTANQPQEGTDQK